MNYTFIINLAHTRMTPLSLGEPESKKIGFVTPIAIFTTSEISKTVNMLSNDGTTNVITR